MTPDLFLGLSERVVIKEVGIIYAKEINAADFSPKDILKVAGMSASYQTEISYGTRLPKYVIVRCNWIGEV